MIYTRGYAGMRAGAVPYTTKREGAQCLSMLKGRGGCGQGGGGGLPSGKASLVSTHMHKHAVRAHEALELHPTYFVHALLDTYAYFEQQIDSCSRVRVFQTLGRVFCVFDRPPRTLDPRSLLWSENFTAPKIPFPTIAAHTSEGWLQGART